MPSVLLSFDIYSGKNGFRKCQATFHHLDISYINNGAFGRITEDFDCTTKEKWFYFIYNDLFIEKCKFIARDGFKGRASV